MAQTNVSAMYIPGASFNLAPIDNFYSPFVENKLLSYISGWVDAEGNTYEDCQEVTLTGDSFDLSAVWAPIDRPFQVTLSNCTAVLSCIPNKKKFADMSSVTELTADQMSGVVYQDSQLVLSVIPAEKHSFVSAALGHYINGINSNSPVLFNRIDGVDNACSTTALSAYINANNAIVRTVTTYLNEYIFAHTFASSSSTHRVLDLSVTCRPNGTLSYWRGDTGGEEA